jgi:HD superfamily phosphohydrolase
MLKTVNTSQPANNDQILFVLGEEIRHYNLINPTHSANQSSDTLMPLGQGGSSVVYLAKQALFEETAILRAIKFFIRREDLRDLEPNVGTGIVSTREFIAEVANISKISHQSIVKIVDAGVHQKGSNPIPFIVSEYVQGPTLRHILEKNESDVTFDGELDHFREKMIKDPSLILDLLIELADAITYMHERGYYHCDIAPKNVFLSAQEDFRVILGDLGLAKDIKADKEIEWVIGTRKYMPEETARHLNKKVEWNIYKSLQPQWDIYAFVITALELCAKLAPAREPPWWKALSSALATARDRDTYKEIASLRERLTFLRPIERNVASVPELAGGFFGKVRNLVPVDPVTTSQRVREVAHHPAVMRLAKVPQLTTAYQLFPGANHTRYEHSLGTFETMRRYLIALLDHDVFLSRLSPEKIELALMYALLSNLTRFSFSGIIHETKPRNKSVLSNFSKAEMLSLAENIKDRKGRTLFALISDMFPRLHPNSIRKLLLADKRAFDEDEQLIYSLLNCSIDARVIDFVRRDAMHLGIAKGDAFELDELLPHLTVYQNSLAIRIHGLSVVEQIISTRYWLYSRIYWNRPNRIYVSMVRALLMSIIARHGADSIRSSAFENDEIGVLFEMNKIAQENGDLDSLNIVKLLLPPEQRLYKAIYDKSIAESPEAEPILNRLDQMDYSEWENVSQEIRAGISNLLDIKPESKHAVLIDLPSEASGRKLGEDLIVVRDDNTTNGAQDVSGIIKGINDSFWRRLRRLRVVVHPDARPGSEASRLKLEQRIGEILQQLLR